MGTVEELQEISIDGFQVVGREMFGCSFRMGAPTATIWYNSLTFNKAARALLNNCERIRIEVNIQKRCILIVPVTQDDRDNVKWIIGAKDQAMKTIDCAAFTTKLYKAWDWDPEYVYKVTGRMVTANRKVMIMYNFSEPMKWKFKKKTKGTENE